MNELLKINQSIADLQKKAKLMVSEGRGNAIADVCMQMTAYNISVKDIASALKGPTRKGVVTQKVTAKKSGKKAESAKVGPKYRGPEGQLWSGRGLAPKWLKELLDAGQSKADFLIADTQAPATDTAP